MMNTALFQNMITRYNELSYTHDYIFGFAFKGNIYMITTTSEILPYILKLDRASRGQGYSIRFSPNTDQKIFLLTQKAELICSKEYFDLQVSESKYNKGEIFEKIVTEKFGQTWEKDNVPFTKGGDVELENGIAYQVKFEKATFTNEKTLARM